jgi:hypothetical protein
LFITGDRAVKPVLSEAEALESVAFSLEKPIKTRGVHDTWKPVTSSWNGWRIAAIVGVPKT